MGKESWWGEPTRKEWALYFLIMLAWFLVVGLWTLVLGSITILLYRQFYKKEEITKRHWIGSRNEWIGLGIFLALGAGFFVYVIYFVFA